MTGPSRSPRGRPAGAGPTRARSSGVVAGAVTVPRAAPVRVRPLARTDLADVLRIDALQTGQPKPRYWRRIFREVLDRPDDVDRIGLAADTTDGIAGYLIAEIRAFEFGSSPCGWIFAVAVDPGQARHGVGSALLHEARRRFRRAGVAIVRTMVRRNDVPVLSFFRANGFAGGAYVQLECETEEVE